MPKWKTLEGQTLEMEEMTIDHLKNCIKMLRNNGFVSWKELEMFNCKYDDPSKIKSSKDKEFLHKRPTITLDDLEKELKRRGC